MAAENVSGDIGYYFTSHFVSFGADVWGGGDEVSPFSPRSTVFAEGTFTLALADNLSVYLDVWSDRHCPDKKTTGMTSPSDVFDGDAIGACKFFYANASNTTNPDVMRITKLTGWTQPDDVFGRENGVRLMASIVAELAIYQNWNAFGILEGAPFQGERAFFTNEFAHSMFDTDFNLYVKVGLSYKF